MIHLFVARDIAPASATIHTRAVNGRLLAYWHLGDSTWVLGGQPGGDGLIELARRIRETLGDLPERVHLDADRKGDPAAVDAAAARSALSRHSRGIGALDGPDKGPLTRMALTLVTETLKTLETVIARSRQATRRSSASKARMHVRRGTESTGSAPLSTFRGTPCSAVRASPRCPLWIASLRSQ